MNKFSVSAFLMVLGLVMGTSAHAFDFMDSAESSGGQRLIVAQCYNPYPNPAAGDIEKVQVAVILKQGRPFAVAADGINVAPATSPNLPPVPFIFTAGGAIHNLRENGYNRTYELSQGSAFIEKESNTRYRLDAISLDRSSNSVTFGITLANESTHSFIAHDCTFSN